MPLIDYSHAADLHNDHPSFNLDLIGADSLFADLPDAESSFSGASWSAEEDVIDITPFVPFPEAPIHHHHHHHHSTSSTSDEVFNFQPSAELAEMEAVAAAHEQRIAPSLFVDISEQHSEVSIHAVGADDEAIAAAEVQESSPSQLRKRSASRNLSETSDDEDDEDEEFGNFAPRNEKPRKVRRTSQGARPSRTAAKLAAIKSKTTRVAQTKLKRKVVPTPATKSEMELAGTLDLSRDELLNMTSDALESYAQRLAAERPLTAEEQKRFKRQRRLIKNRESAQLSRLRKKAYVDELEKQIAELEEEKERFKKRCEAQEKEGEAMRSELTHLRELVAQHPSLVQMSQTGGSGTRRQKLVQ